MGLMKNMAIERRESRRRGYRSSRAGAMIELERFRRQWTENMVKYWQERIDKMKINDTGQLRSSIMGMIHQGPSTTIEHSFLVYGIYVSNGVGREFGSNWGSRGGEGTWNGGQLPFLLPGGEAYRAKHGLDKPKKVGPAWGGRVAGGHPREKRDWFYRKYASSRHILNEMEAAAYGNAYNGMLTEAFDTLFQRHRVF